MLTLFEARAFGKLSWLMLAILTNCSNPAVLGSAGNSILALGCHSSIEWQEEKPNRPLAFYAYLEGNLKTAGGYNAKENIVDGV